MLAILRADIDERDARIAELEKEKAELTIPQDVLETLIDMAEFTNKRFCSSNNKP
jgi:hypothetical protein